MLKTIKSSQVKVTSKKKLPKILINSSWFLKIFTTKAEKLIMYIPRWKKKKKDDCLAVCDTIMFVQIDIDFKM